MWTHRQLVSSSNWARDQAGKKSEQKCCCPTDWRLSASCGTNWGFPLTPSPQEHHSIIMLMGLRGAFTGSLLCREPPVSQTTDVIFFGGGLNYSGGSEVILGNDYANDYARSYRQTKRLIWASVARYAFSFFLARSFSQFDPAQSSGFLSGFYISETRSHNFVTKSERCTLF